MYRKVITNNGSYIPVEWGTRVEGEDAKIVAFVHYVRTDQSYDFYGRDADVYEEFEREGFVREKVVNTYEEAEAWKKEQVFGG